MDVRDGVGGSWVFYNHVVDLLVLAFVETNPEIRLGQGAKVVANLGIFCRHIDEQSAERQLLDKLMLVGFQYAHETEVLGRDFGVKVALEDGVRHLVAEDDETATADAKQTLRAALDVLDDALVTFVKDNQHGVKSLEIRHFSHWFLGEELLQSTS